MSLYFCFVGGVAVAGIPGSGADDDADVAFAHIGPGIVVGGGYGACGNEWKRGGKLIEVIVW